MASRNVFVILAALIFATVWLFRKYQTRRVNHDTRSEQWPSKETAQRPSTPITHSEDVPSNETPAIPTYEKVFPPHRRRALADLPSDAMKGPGKTPMELSRQPPNYEKNIPDKVQCDSEQFNDHVTPTGFTVEEIKRLGNFPDYATLSGIPLPTPYVEFDIDRAKERPYRPMRWPYFQTMSLQKLDTDMWLELEKTYVQKIRARQEFYRKYGEKIMQVLPGSELATKETMEMALQFLCARYPMHFTLDVENMLFYNGLLETRTDLKSTPPLTVLLDNVPEDFAIMLRDPDTGLYSFRAGVICSALGWSLDLKIGLKLHEIHGDVADYPEKMQFSMNRYFAKKATEKCIQRGSWGLAIDEPLYRPRDDAYAEERGKQDERLTLDRINFRVDWQTLRRLPLSGAVLFNFKGLFTPVTAFRDEPYMPSILLKVLHEGKKNLMEYKETWHTEHVVIPAMEQYEKEQIAEGLIEEDWEARTMVEHPFFPGWEEKWHREQGF